MSIRSSLQQRTQNSVLWLASITLMASLTSCASLITPNLETEVRSIKAGDYVLDSDHASLLFKVNHMGFSQYIGRFNRFDASLNFAPEAIENSALDVVIDMTSVDVNNPEFEKSLNGKSWFNTDQYPQAHFKTVSAKSSENGRATFVGELTFLGVTQPVELAVVLNGAANNLLTGKYTLGFSGSASFSRSDFGLKRYVPAVGDTIELEIHVEFQRQN